MRYWNVGDSLMRRALSAEFASLSPQVLFLAGPQGGVEMQLCEAPVGLWVEAKRDMFTFICQSSGEALVEDCDVVSAVHFVRELLMSRGQRLPGELELRA